VPSENQNSHAPPLWQPRTQRWFIGVFGFALFYTVLRYIVFAQVPVDQWPLFLGNKAISLAGLILLALSYTIGKISILTDSDKGRQLVLVKFCGLFGFTLIAMHVFASLAILSPAPFPEFYTETGAMNFIGQLSMFMGVFSLWCFTMPVITSIPHMFEAIGGERWIRGQRMGYIGLAIAALHVTIMGFEGWFTLGEWPGYMPPITALAALAALIPLVLRMRQKRDGL
jgi:DMSO/TMAO reductase YedYZ heme-binding membrane subunit